MGSTSFNIVEKSPIDVDLNLIINARDHLLHSLGDISEEFISEIDKYLEPLRIIAIHGIGQMLDLDSKLIETVSSKKPLRMFKVTASVYKGRFENLNNDIEWLLNNLPEFKVHENPRKYHLDDEGNPVVDINFSTTARFADNVKFTPYSWHMIGVKDAGIKPISFTFNE